MTKWNVGNHLESRISLQTASSLLKNEIHYFYY
jgi:hypothetical protein